MRYEIKTVWYLQSIYGPTLQWGTYETVWAEYKRRGKPQDASINQGSMFVEPKEQT